MLSTGSNVPRTLRVHPYHPATTEFTIRSLPANLHATQLYLSRLLPLPPTLAYSTLGLASHQPDSAMAIPVLDPRTRAGLVPRSDEDDDVHAHARALDHDLPESSRRRKRA